MSLGDHEVFVKVIPLTKRQADHPYTTANHDQLPVWYNYGVGSAGFNPFRELAACEKTTGWVREGLTNSFPLLHHQRILELPEQEDQSETFDTYAASWNDSEAIKQYMIQRQEATHFLVLCLEKLTPLSEWFFSNQPQVEDLLPKAIETIRLLHKNQMIHFDAHALNWLTDGRDLMLTDFGLALDQDFDLSAEELEFFKTHKYYDYGQALDTVSNVTLPNYFSLSQEQQADINQALDCGPDNFPEFLYRITRDALDLHTRQLLVLSESEHRLFSRLQGVIDLTNEFFHTLKTGEKKLGVYPETELKAELEKLGVI